MTQARSGNRPLTGGAESLRRIAPGANESKGLSRTKGEMNVPSGSGVAHSRYIFI
jgi:hypothetical protein